MLLEINLLTSPYPAAWLEDRRLLTGHTTPEAFLSKLPAATAGNMEAEGCLGTDATKACEGSTWSYLQSKLDSKELEAECGQIA